MAVFDPDSFGIHPEWRDDEVWVTHFDVTEKYRRQKLGSAVLETLKRVYYYEGATSLNVRMGGGDAAKAFLEANDFEITEIREYEGAPGGYGVTACYEYNRNR